MTEETVTTDQLGRARELIAETERVRQWLDRLDDRDSDRPPHIVDRVRSDYHGRLERLTEQLRSHRTTVEASLDESRHTLEERERALSELRDRFEELRLRHEIGEIDDDEWTAERPRVENELTEVERERDTERERFDGLEALLAELGPGTAEREVDERSGAAGEVEGSGDAADTEPPAPEPEEPDAAPAEAEAAEAAAAQASVDAAFDQWDPPESSPGAPEETDDESDATADDDLAFLEDLDRAIASPGPRPPAATPSTPSAESDAAAQRLPCKECGAVNDPRAWYCEVCGMELS